MASNSPPEVNAITIQTHDLVLALSNEPVGVAGILLGKGFISAEIMSKILVVSYTPTEKATILIEAIRNKIELAPSKFTELLDILSEVACAKEVVESLRSTYQTTSLLISTSDMSQSVESTDQPAESREQGAPVKAQSESHVSEAETSLQPLLKSETNETTSMMLSEKDLVRLMRLLQNCSSKWNPIGLSLGFIQSELDTIFGMLKLLIGAPVSYLQELLSQWVQWPTADHPSHPTVGALCTALRSSLVGLGSLAQTIENEFKEREHTSGVILVDEYIRNENVADKIEQLESKFRDLHKCIRNELQGMSVNELLQSLTLLPTKLKKEYETQVMKKLPELQKEEKMSQLFLHLNPLFTFIDYALLEYIIQRFGSPTLKQRMLSYSREIQKFMSQTTIQQLIDYWPCTDKESVPDMSKIIAKITKNPRECKLSELDDLRKKICISMRLSDIICAMVSVESSQSFVVIWRLPSILAQVVIESMHRIGKNFFKFESIESVSIDDKQVYPKLLSLESAKAKAIGLDQEQDMDTEKHALLKTQDQTEYDKFSAIQLDKEIQAFVICGVPSGKDLGRGSLGSVKEIEVEGLVCAGKMFNEELFANESPVEVTSKYVNLCKILSRLHHPNIIQFIGVCFLQDNYEFPVIVTEKLEGNLHCLLETVVNIPMVLKQSLLEDVARGLHYLHTFNPAISHGVLTARNVLYTSSLVAKIADISNTQLVSLQSMHKIQALPFSTETVCYQPSSVTHQCSPELDIFSFGNLALFTLSQMFPKPDQKPYQKAVQRRVSQSEIDSRKPYIQHVDRLFPNHVLMKTIKRCLSSDPKKRPTARQLLTSLKEITEGTSISRMAAARQVLIAKDFADFGNQLREITEEHNKIVQEKEREIDEITESKEREIKELSESKEKEIKELTESKDREIRELEESKEKEIEELRARLKSEQRQPEKIVNRAVQLQPSTSAASRKGGRALPKNQDIVALTILCGYYATPREEPTPEGYTHDWTAFVKGDHERDLEEDGSNLKHVVRKVVFQLHEDFKPNATRVVKDPPYKISVSGNGSFELMIKVYFNNNEKAKFQYGLNLFTCEVSKILRDVLTFRNPSKSFRERLILAGGEPAQSLPTTSQQKAKPKKRPSKSTPIKSKKKRRLEIGDESDSDLDTSSWSEGNKSVPIITSDSSSDDEWILSQAIKI